MTRGILAVIGLLALGACGSRGDEERAAEAAGTTAVDSVPAADPHAGHDMAAMTDTATAQAHAEHTVAPAPSVHETHVVGAALSRAESAPVAAGHHVAEPATAVRAPEDDATDKLLRLGRALTRDSLVRAAIEADPALREGWSDPAVRREIEAAR